MVQWDNIQYIIFDLDGVIVNSESLHYEAYRRAFEKNGLFLSLKSYNASLRSKGRREGLIALINENECFLIDEVSKEKDRVFTEMIESEQIQLYDDAINLIKMCKDKAIPIAIGTASKMGKIVLEKIGLTAFFDAIITSEDVIHNKPDPEIYNHCREALNADTNMTLVIEDSEAGIIAALKANLNVVYIKRDGGPAVNSIYLNNENVFVCNDLNIVSAYLFKHTY